MGNPTGEILRFPIVQTTGTERKKVISQKVVTEELNKRVPATRKINGKTLANDVTLTAADLSVYTKAEIDGLMTVNKDQTDRLEINNRWLVTASGRGIIPAQPGDGRVGTTTNRFAEAWVNVYRGSEIVLSGNGNIGGKLRTGGTIYQKTTGRTWAMGMVTSSSENKGVVGVTKDDGQTFSDYIRIGPNRELVHHVTINDNPEEYDIYTKYNKPAPMDIGVYSKAEIDSKLAEIGGGGQSGEIRVKEWMRGVNPVGGGYAFIGTDGKAYASVRGFAGNNRALAPGRRSENESNIGLHEILAGPGEIGAVGFIGQYTGYVWNKTTADILTWGRNENGTAGGNSTENFISRPLRANTGFRAVAIEPPRCVGGAGDSATMAFKRDTGEWYVWGGNSTGAATGDPTYTTNPMRSPQKLANPKEGVSIVRLWNFSSFAPWYIALGSDGLLYTLGSNAQGGAGASVATTHLKTWTLVNVSNFPAGTFPVPQDKLLDEDYLQISGSSGYWSTQHYARQNLIVLAKGTIAVCGSGEWGANGTGANTDIDTLTVPVGSIVGKTIVSFKHSGGGGVMGIVAQDSTGALHCWGYGESGCVRNVGTGKYPTPVILNAAVLPGRYWTDERGGGAYSYRSSMFYQRTNEQMQCKGRNEYGQLMVDSEWVTEAGDLRSAVTMLDVKDIFFNSNSGATGACAVYLLTTDGKLYSLGYGNGGSTVGTFSQGDITTSVRGYPQRIV